MAHHKSLSRHHMRLAVKRYSLIAPGAFVVRKSDPQVDAEFETQGHWAREVSYNPGLLGWIEGFFEAGGGKHLDVLSFHAFNCVNGDLLPPSVGRIALMVTEASTGTANSLRVVSLFGVESEAKIEAGRAVGPVGG